MENNSKFCQYCGRKDKLISLSVAKGTDTCWTCNYCEREFDTKKQSDEHEKFCQLNPGNIIKSKAENSSGLGENSVIPDEIKGWSWGGFLWGWVWAIGNKTWIGLLALIPYVGLIVHIVLGLKGREWAWKNKKWDSVEHFKKIQKRWVICWLFLGIFPLVAILSVAILATINPIEQANKAKDASIKNDLAEVMGANERYYANNNSYPWGNTSEPYTSSNIAGELWLDKLVIAGEIKDITVNKIKSYPTGSVLINENGLNGGQHLCFLPLSDANKKIATQQCNAVGTFTNIWSKSLCVVGEEYLCIP